MSNGGALVLVGGVVGIFIGLLLGMAATLSFSETIQESNDVIRFCESNIPRSQHCKITAVPVIDEPPKEG